MQALRRFRALSSYRLLPLHQQPPIHSALLHRQHPASRLPQRTNLRIHDRSRPHAARGGKRRGHDISLASQGPNHSSAARRLTARSAASSSSGHGYSDGFPWPGWFGVNPPSPYNTVTPISRSSATLRENWRCCT